MSSKSRSLPDCALSGTKLAVKNKKEKPPVQTSPFPTPDSCFPDYSPNFSRSIAVR